MVSVAVRVLVKVLIPAVQLTEPLPLPVAGVKVSQLALLLASQAHPAVAVTVTLPLAPVAGTAETLVGEMLKEPEPAAWLTVKTWPAMVNVAERALQPALAAAAHVT